MLPSNVTQLPGSQWMSRDEVARYLGVSLSTLHNWLRAPDPIPSAKRFGTRRFLRSEVDAWMANKGAAA